jgi:hypothetical protein
MQIEPEVADVGTALCIDDHVVAVEGCDVAQFGMDDQPVVVEAQHSAIGHRHHEQRAIGQPSEAARLPGHLDLALDVAVEIEGLDRQVVHVAEPQGAVVPPGSFAEAETCGERLGLVHG